MRPVKPKLEKKKVWRCEIDLPREGGHTAPERSKLMIWSDAANESAGYARDGLTARVICDEEAVAALKPKTEGDK